MINGFSVAAVHGHNPSIRPSCSGTSNPHIIQSECVRWSLSQTKAQTVAGEMLQPTCALCVLPCVFTCILLARINMEMLDECPTTGNTTISSHSGGGGWCTSNIGSSNVGARHNFFPCLSIAEHGKKRKLKEKCCGNDDGWRLCTHKNRTRQKYNDNAGYTEQDAQCCCYRRQ